MTPPPGPPPGFPGGSQPGQPGWGPPAMACARHPDRETLLRCTRCDRPMCPECLRPASVGSQCVDCVAQGQRLQPGQRRATTIAGAEPGTRNMAIPALVAVNVVVYLITVAQAGSLDRNDRSELFAQWGLWPPAVAGGEFWRLLTSGFLHYGPIHLAFNMVALWVIGRDLLAVLGRTRFLAVYTTSLLGGSTAVFLLQGADSVTAGASGAVYGLMGGLAVVLLRLRRSPGPALSVIAINVVISVVVPGISLLGHLGGLVVGAMVTTALVYAPRARRVPVQVGAVVGVLVVLAALVLVRDAQFGDVGECSTEPVLRCVVTDS